MAPSAQNFVPRSIELCSAFSATKLPRRGSGNKTLRTVNTLSFLGEWAGWVPKSFLESRLVLAFRAAKLCIVYSRRKGNAAPAAFNIA